MSRSRPTLAQLTARHEALIALEYHQKQCVISTQQIEPRLRALENRFWLLVGLMTGGGLLGGATSAAILKALGG